METTVSNPFIFYLTLDDSLPGPFYSFDRTLKELGFILVPVKIDQLQSLISSSDQDQIIVMASVRDVREYRQYQEKVRGLLRYVLKSKRLTFMLLSSFSKLNDTKSYTLTKNYFFLKYPLDARLLSEKIASYHDLKLEINIRWPGGKRAGLGVVS